MLGTVSAAGDTNRNKLRTMILKHIMNRREYYIWCKVRKNDIIENVPWALKPRADPDYVAHLEDNNFVQKALLKRF
jgi:hypothetical protein